MKTVSLLEAALPLFYCMQCIHNFFFRFICQFFSIIVIVCLLYCMSILFGLNRTFKRFLVLQIFLFCSSAFVAGRSQTVKNDIWLKSVHASMTISTECPLYHMDLMFLLDGSASIRGQEFQQLLKFVKDVASSFHLADTRIGVMQYSHYYSNRYIQVLKVNLMISLFKSK